MQYYIDYEQTTGRILGFITNLSRKQGKTIEVDFFKFNEAMAFNKIILDGKNIIFEKVDWRTAEEINDIRIKEIESKCNQVIESVYPIYKQINITNLLTPYTEEDRDVMKAFIDSKRAICHKAIADGTKAEDVEY